MDFLTSLAFFYIVMLFLWAIKADFLFILFAIAIFFFIIINQSILNPIEIALEIFSIIINNPSQLTILLIPVLGHVILIGIKRFTRKKTKTS